MIRVDKFYLILDELIESNYFFNLLEGFDSVLPLHTDISLTWKINETVCSGACYGIQYIAQTNTISTKQMFFSQKDETHFLYPEAEDYSKICLTYDGTFREDVALELFMVGFYSYMSQKQTLLMHASAVEYEGQGIVFTAASGVGKTTQAELWAKYKNAKILNGDKVFLKKEEDGIHAWGSPWKGASSYGCNKSAKLRAIVVLEQAEENSIQKLNVLESMQYFVPHIFFPCWDEVCEHAVLTFLDKVLEETEVYLLKCRPDEEAVELLASTIKG